MVWFIHSLFLLIGSILIAFISHTSVAAHVTNHKFSKPFIINYCMCVCVWVSQLRTWLVNYFKCQSICPHSKRPNISSVNEDYEQALWREEKNGQDLSQLRNAPITLISIKLCFFFFHLLPFFWSISLVQFEIGMRARRLRCQCGHGVVKGKFENK